MKPHLLVILVLLAGASPLRAQDNAPEWRIIPRAGTYFGDDTDAFVLQRSSDILSQTASLHQGAIIGLALDFDSPLMWLGFRLSADRTVGAEATFVRTANDEGCPELCLFESTETDATVISYSLDVRIQPVPRNWPVRPFVVGGFDRLRIELDEEDPDKEVRPALHFGYGADFNIAGLPLRIEGMHRRFYEDTPPGSQMHYVLMGGVRIPID